MSIVITKSDLEIFRNLIHEGDKLLWQPLDSQPGAKVKRVTVQKKYPNYCVTELGCTYYEELLKANPNVLTDHYRR